MGVGGATWDDAGALDMGAGNTFVVADGDPGPPNPRHRAWWIYTPAVPEILTLDTFASIWTGADPFKADTQIVIFKGATEGVATEVDYTIELDDAGGPYVWLSTVTAWLSAGITYHIRVGEWWGDPDNAITDYVLTASKTTLSASPWFDDLQDDDNYLIAGSLEDMNVPDYDPLPEWADDIVRYGAGRRGHYRVQGALGGAAVNTTDAYTCTMTHAFVGHNGSQVWNADGISPDPTDPVCWVLPTPGTDDDGDVERNSTSWSIVYDPGILPFVGPDTQADVTGSAYGMWFLPVRDRMPPWGVLPVPDPVDYGYPADATIEWEDEEVELVRIDVAEGSLLGTGTAPYTHEWYLNNGYGPTWAAGSSVWKYGVVSTAGSDLAFTYDDGDVVWHEVPDTVGWAGHGWEEDYTGANPPSADGMMIVQPEQPPYSLGGDTRDAFLAVKFVLRASRFRFVYEGEIVTSVIRQYPRDDELGWGSGTRLYPPPKADRIIGGIQ